MNKNKKYPDYDCLIVAVFRQAVEDYQKIILLFRLNDRVGMKRFAKELGLDDVSQLKDEKEYIQDYIGDTFSEYARMEIEGRKYVTKRKGRKRTLTDEQKAEKYELAKKRAVERDRVKRAERKKLCLCRMCGKNKWIDGMTVCENCLDKSREYTRRQNEKRKERKRSMQKTT